MASYEIKIDTRKMQNIIRNEPERADRWLRGVANEILGDIVLSFNTSPPGRSYKRRKQGACSITAWVSAKRRYGRVTCLYGRSSPEATSL